MICFKISSDLEKLRLMIWFKVKYDVVTLPCSEGGLGFIDLVNQSKADPYAVLFIRRVDNLIKKSTLVHDTSDPVWNESFQFDVCVS